MRPETLDMIRKIQLSEMTEHVIYKDLARFTKGKNAKILQEISIEERKHAGIWKRYTNRNYRPGYIKVLLYRFLKVVFGITFVVNLLEYSTASRQEIYNRLSEELPDAISAYQPAEAYEDALFELIDEERLKYISSMVLGLNDALVELTGALAGFTFALGNTTTITLAGFITGSAATLSMTASEYLAKKHDPTEHHPLKAATYTGFAYMIVVTLLLLPYIFFTSPIIALGAALANAAFVIFIFTFYVSVVRKEHFRPAFLEMLGISFSVAAISFVIGWVARVMLHINL